MKLFISLECKYNKLQFGIRISSIEVSKQKRHISKALMSTTKLTAKKSIQERQFHSQEWKGFRSISS